MFEHDVKEAPYLSRPRRYRQMYIHPIATAIMEWPPVAPLCIPRLRIAVRRRSAQILSAIAGSL
jgi:hypothetical protein